MDKSNLISIKNNYFQKSVSNEIGKKIIDNELKRINLKKDLILKLAKYSAKKKLKTENVNLMILSLKSFENR